MKANELMIGDWVMDIVPAIIDAISNEDICTYRNEYGYVTANPSNLNPIPLTPEILEKNGFEKSERYDVWKIINERYELRITPWRVAIIFLMDDGSDECEYSVPRSKFIHELQHALRICGIDKEIVI